jgi:hypothetical protein
MRWADISEARYEPHILVDAASAPGTVLALSHWRQAPTPARLRADTSVEICLRWLVSGRPRVACSLVVTDHLDQDSLVGAWSLLHPEEALGAVELLVGVAEAGDFVVVRSRRAARVSFALASLANPETSPIDVARLRGDAARAELGRELLGRLEELLADPGRYRELWAEEDDFFERSFSWLSTGRVRIRERPEADLAVVEIPPGEGRVSHFFHFEAGWGCHPAAIHNQTKASCLLLLQEHHPQVVFRYEGWVAFQSRQIPPRVDLSSLAAELESEEPTPAGWRFDGVSELVAWMRPERASALDPAYLEERLVQELVRGRDQGRFWHLN